jgi:ATP/maltotriose-dependent transcriptional regulator MalT
VIVRLARLPQAARALAAAVSILGDDAEPRHARALADLDEPDARGAADALARLSILRRGERLSFVHPIVRSAVYDEIAPRERAALHRDAARLLMQDRAEPGRVASHLLATDPDADPAVVAALRAAAREALSQGAPELAVRYLRRALSEPAAPDERPDLVRQLLAARIAARDIPAGEDLDECIDVLRSDPRMLAQAAPDLTLPLAAAGRGQDAARLIEQAIDAVMGVDDELALRLEGQFPSLAAMVGVDWKTVRRRLRRFADDPPAGRTPAECVVLAQVALHLGQTCELTPERAGELAERAVRRRDFIAQSTFGTLWLDAAGRALITADRLELAEEVLQDAVAEARRHGSAAQYMIASFFRSWLAYRQGRVLDAEAEARNAVEVAKPGGILAGMPYIVGFLVDALVERGRLGEAEAALEESGLVGELPDTSVSTTALLHRGRLRLAQGRTEEGVADLLEVGRRTRRDGFLDPGFFPWASLAAPAMAARGERDRARELIEEELRLARWFGRPLAIGAALQGRALVEGGEERVDLLREAVDVLRDSYARLEYARAMTELGVSLSRANRQVEARKTLGEAMDLAQRCGATALAQRAREELVAAGARPRRLMLSGVDSLTASERKVAQLAAEGLSNPEIAQALFVTRKTVEKHLGNAYTKLNVGSRSELPDALAP